MVRKSKDAIQNVNPDDEVECLRLYTELTAEAARIGQRIATMFGRFNKLGVDTKGIKAAYKRAQAADPTKEHERQTALEIRLGIIKVTWDDEGQGSFADMAMPSEDAMLQLALGQARFDGYNAGKGGRLKDSSPCEAGTEQHVLWLEGWEVGHEDRLAAGKGDIVKKRRETADASTS